MTPPTTPQPERRAAPPTRPSLYWPLGCAWCLSLICFSAPGREGAETVDALDIIALVKVGVRLLTIAVLGITLFRAWNLPRRKVISAVMLPYGLFVGWAVVTTLWSALKAVSLGQASGLLGLFLLASCLAVLWRGPEDTSRIVFHLTAATTLFSVIMVVTDTVRHDLSGLDRIEFTEFEGRSTGIIHPTTGGATSSIGLVLLFGAWWVFEYPWAKKMLLPAGAFLVALLYLAMSRTAIGMAAMAIGAMFVLRLKMAYAAPVSLILAAIGLGMIITDPTLEFPNAVVSKVGEVLTRGESAQQLSSFTGRTDLWDAIWAEYYKSPLIGHGYFVTSAKGEIDVWSGPANRSAHNTLLQVLVTTGALGLLLFLCGLAWPIGLAVRSFYDTWREDRGIKRRPKGVTPAEPYLGIFLVMAAIWYAGWGQMSESFMGPVQPESVVFYCLFGLAAAQVRRSYVIRAAQGSSPKGPRVAPAVGGAT